MAHTDLNRATLRRLADQDATGGPVLSLYVNLDPAQFAVPAARATAIRSVVDDAARRLKQRDGLSREERAALTRDLERARSHLERDLDARGAHAIALFAGRGGDLFETVRLPRAVPSEVTIARKPFIEPLVDLIDRGRWAVLLVNRRNGRIFRGSRERLDEVALVSDDVHGQHRQGGLSHTNYERSIEKDADDHVRRTAEALFDRWRRASFDHLLLAAHVETLPILERVLHPYLAERVVGRLRVDVENATAEQVLAAAQPEIDAYERRLEREALDRLAEGVGRGGRAASGLEEVLEALTEQRVQTLIVRERMVAAGVRCPHCGWLGPEEVEQCPRRRDARRAARRRHRARGRARDLPVGAHRGAAALRRSRALRRPRGRPALLSRLLRRIRPWRAWATATARRDAGRAPRRARRSRSGPARASRGRARSPCGPRATGGRW